jgi:prepilin-type N-terminal cleavage/methylation domain-containing protein
MNKKGFTMIELLIVIGVLGILAVGVLATVDPFEQLKKARDTNDRQSAISLHTAFTRYYATHGNLPWAMSTPPSDCDAFTDFAGAASDYPSGTDVDSMADCITNSLIADGELKEGFVGAIGIGDRMFVTSSSQTASDLAVCFAPQSKAVFAEDVTKFDAMGVDLSGAGSVPLCDNTAKSTGATIINDCYYCAK